MRMYSKRIPKNVFRYNKRDSKFLGRKKVKRGTTWILDHMYDVAVMFEISNLRLSFHRPVYFQVICIFWLNA